MCIRCNSNINIPLNKETKKQDEEDDDDEIKNHQQNKINKIKSRT